MEQTEFIKIGGFVPLTTIDYPGHLSAVIFCQGCPWRCRYCQNKDLIIDQSVASYSWDYIIKFLKNRHGLLDAVVFSGGEPTIQKKILYAIQEVKKMGFLVGLHTNGMYPDKLSLLLPYLNWIGLDIKNLPRKYEDITGIPNSGNRILESLELLIKSQISFECRTTFHSHLIDLDSLLTLGDMLSEKGVTNYTIQECQTKNCLDPSLPYNFIPQELKNKIHDHFSNIFKSFTFRN